MNRPNSKTTLIGTIAGICALGTGMLAAATVLSTPISLILFLAAGFVVNYSLPLFYRWLAARWPQSKEAEYIKKVLLSNNNLQSLGSKHSRNIGLTRAFWTGVASLMISLALATAFYFTLALAPIAILSPIIAVLMFAALAIVTYMNFNHEIRNIWDSRSEVSSAFQKISFSWKSAVVVLTFSALAAGVLVGALTRDGVRTTLPSLASGQFLSSIISAVGGPFAWVVFSCVLVSTFAMMSYCFFDLMNDEKRKAKIDMFRALFTSADKYKSDLDTQWQTVCGLIGDIKGNENRTDEDIATLNELYRQKDSIYHRYTVYSQPWFNTLYKGITFLVMGVAMAGMCMHLARGYQGLDTMLQAKSIGIAHSLATGIATGMMYLGMLAESFFTTTIVTSTMDEEAMLGKQTRQYEEYLDQQESKQNKAEGYFFQTSRGMHFIFEGLLGLFGAEGGDHGHGTKTGQAFADRPATQPFLGAGMGLRAGFERHGGDNKLVTFKYDINADIDAEKPIEVTNPSLKLNKASTH